MKIMDWIKNKVGLQAILRSHNSYMSKKEFKDFWRGIQGKSKKAFRRYIKRKQTQKYKKSTYSLKFLLSIVVFFQIGGIALGTWLVQTDDPSIFCMGVFIIITNIVFGGVNVRGLLS